MPPITYEITAVVRPDLEAAWLRYMIDTHVPDLLATGCFRDATISGAAPGRYRIRYEAHDRAALDRYLTDHAPRLRDDAVKNFPEGVELTREEWEIIRDFTLSQ